MKRTKVTEIVLDVIGNLSDEQDRKGIKEYGVSLDDVPFGCYDWNNMAMQEMVDGLKYLVMENYKLKAENKALRLMLNK